MSPSFFSEKDRPSGTSIKNDIQARVSNMTSKMKQTTIKVPEEPEKPKTQWSEHVWSKFINICFYSYKENRACFGEIH